MKAADEIRAGRMRSNAWADGVEAGKQGAQIQDNPYLRHRDPIVPQRWLAGLVAGRRLTSVPADRLGAPPQTDRDDTAAAEHSR